MSYWILEKMRPKRVSYFEYAAWIETNDRRIDFTEIGDIRVRTVFCGVDHSFGDGPPLLFETTVTGGAYENSTWRYATLGEAKRGHHDAVDEVKAGRFG